MTDVEAFLRQRAEKLNAMQSPLQGEHVARYSAAELEELNGLYGECCLDPERLLAWWDDYCTLVHFAAHLEPQYQHADFAAYLVGCAERAEAPSDENEAAHAQDRGRAIMGNGDDV